MIRFILKRILNGLLVLWGVVTIVFFIFQILPGDPVSMMMGQRGDEAAKKAIKKELGLDLPLYQQYFFLLNDVSPLSLHQQSAENAEKYQYWGSLDMGNLTVAVKPPYLRRSFQSNQRVTTIISERFPATFWLAVSSMLLATIVGIAMGTLAALFHKSIWDQLLVTFSVIGISVPSFVSAVVFGYLFAVVWHDVTGLSLYGNLWELHAYTGKTLELKNLILPAFTLGIRPLAIVTQLTRSSMLDVMGEDYVRTARAKGLTEFRVITRHVLRNALNPVTTAVSGWFASLLAGAFFIEQVFNWKGIGLATINAVFARDFPVVMGMTIFIAALFVLVNLMVDVVYTRLDPRVRLS